MDNFAMHVLFVAMCAREAGWHVSQMLSACTVCIYSAKVKNGRYTNRTYSPEMCCICVNWVTAQPVGSVKSLLKRLSTAVSGLSIHCIVAFYLDSAAELYSFPTGLIQVRSYLFPAGSGLIFKQESQGLKGGEGDLHKWLWNQTALSVLDEMQESSNFL